MADNTSNSRFTRATSIIRQYPRSLIRFAHSSASSASAHIASRLYYFWTTPRLFFFSTIQMRENVYKKIPFLCEHRINENYSTYPFTYERD